MVSEPDSSHEQASVMAVSSSSLPPNLSLLISNFQSLVTVKLDSSNFLIWKHQLQNVLRATELFDFVTGVIPCPASQILDPSGKVIENPEFARWKIIDAHLLSCITATLSSSVFSTVLHCQH